MDFQDLMEQTSNKSEYIDIQDNDIYEVAQPTNRMEEDLNNEYMKVSNTSFNLSERSPKSKVDIDDIETVKTVQSSEQEIPAFFDLDTERPNVNQDLF